ncbi:MAG: hypothetical protein DRJ64_02575 [Thermoprotei archaeon]|nr:MAG: hypothetical protein DRJ64_02575 [Thermoprotei archaeon]
MSWIGVEEGKINIELLEKYLNENGFLILNKIRISVKTSKNWIDFVVFEVSGFTEGLADVISRRFNVISLEGGKHLILGETSAKLWDEAVKIVFPNGDSEIVPIFTFDGFLDLRMPTENIRGVNPTILVSGKLYTLPLSLDDVLEIYKKGKKFFEKIEKVATIYGVDKVISREAMDILKERSKKSIKIEVDYETGYVLISNGVSLTTKTLSSYFLSLIFEDNIEEALKIYNDAPSQVKDELKNLVIEELEIQKNLNAFGNVIKLKRFIEKSGIKFS